MTRASVFTRNKALSGFCIRATSCDVFTENYDKKLRGCRSGRDFFFTLLLSSKGKDAATFFCAIHRSCALFSRTRKQESETAWTAVLVDKFRRHEYISTSTARLAQWIRRSTTNRKIVGSIPMLGECTFFFPWAHVCLRFIFIAEI